MCLYTYVHGYIYVFVYICIHINTYIAINLYTNIAADEICMDCSWKEWQSWSECQNNCYVTEKSRIRQKKYIRDRLCKGNKMKCVGDNIEYKKLSLLFD